MKQFRQSIIIFVVMTFICGVIYPIIITVTAQLIFPNKANGSMVSIRLEDGYVIDYGSTLIGQTFTEPKYLIGRPMDIAVLSPESKEQVQLVKERIEWWQELDPDNKELIPIDLVTASGSSVDPNISIAAAKYQIKRIAREREISESEVQSIINKYTTNRFLGFWGEAAVNVLKVNLALDGLI